MENSNRPEHLDRYDSWDDHAEDPFYGIDDTVDRMLADDGGDSQPEDEQ